MKKLMVLLCMVLLLVGICFGDVSWRDICKEWLLADSYADITEDGIVNLEDFSEVASKVSNHIYYIDGDAGSDSSSGLTIGDAFLTINKALDFADDRLSGDTITINIVPRAASAGYGGWQNCIKLDNIDSRHEGINFILQSTTEENYILNDNTQPRLVYCTGVTSGSVTLKNATIDSVGTDGPFYWAANYGCRIIAIDCTINVLDEKILVYSSGGVSQSSRDASFTRCMINTTGQSNGVVRAAAVHDLTFDNCVITGLSSSYDFITNLGSSAGSGGFIQLIDTDISGCRRPVHLYHTSGSLEGLVIKNCNLDNEQGVSIVGPVHHIDIQGDISTTGTGYFTNNCITIAMPFSGVEVYKQGTAPLSPSEGDRWFQTNINIAWVYNSGEFEIIERYFDSIRIHDCNLVATGASTKALYLGHIVVGAEIAYNKWEGNSHTFSLHGHQCSIHHNIGKGVGPMYIFGDNNTVNNNTIYATNTGCLLGSPAGEGPAGERWESGKDNTVYNNIFVCEATGTYALTDYSNSTIRDENDPMRDYIDYNCYYRIDSSTLVYLNSISCTTIEEVRNVWASGTADGSGTTSWNELYPNNDSHSIIADPQFKDAENGDFTPINSDLMTAGVNGGYVGAVLNQSLYNSIYKSNDLYGSGEN